MGSLFALSKNPTFRAKVGLPQAGEADVPVEFVFRYRTRAELDKFDETVDGKKNNVDVILDMCEGWDFEEPFNRENIEELLQRSIGAAVAIHKKYKDELVKVRVGN